LFFGGAPPLSEKAHQRASTLIVFFKELIEEPLEEALPKGP
jgi:hypothetical protein